MKKKRLPVPENPNHPETLEAFARCVEERLGKSNLGPFATQRLVCRMMTQAGPQQAQMIAKWAEWRYGQAKKNINVTGNITHEHFDATKLSDEQLAVAEQLIESANAGSDQG